MSPHMRVEFHRVPYWRALRPRWVWILVGASVGFAYGFGLGVVLFY